MKKHMEDHDEHLAFKFKDVEINEDGNTNTVSSHFPLKKSSGFFAAKVCKDGTLIELEFKAEAGAEAEQIAESLQVLKSPQLL